MEIFPAIDLYDKKAVRLYKGDYAQMTIYSEHPEEIARDFCAAGAGFIHVVDLAGARDGDTPNFDTVKRIVTEAEKTGAHVEIGGGIRDMTTVKKYLDTGIWRVILGTAAITNPTFLKEAVDTFGGERIAVGVDLRDGRVSIKGWTETSKKSGIDFCRELEKIGIGGVIVTDISRDGAMQGTNRDLYRTLIEQFDLNIVASGGVSTLADIRALAKMNLFGAIVGKAYYTGDISLTEAIKEGKQ